MDRVRELLTKHRNGKLVALAFILAGSFLHFKPDPWRDNTSTTPGVLTSKPIHHRSAGSKHRGSHYEFNYSYVVNGATYAGHGRTSTEPRSLTVYYQTNNPSESRLDATDDAEKLDGILVVLGIVILVISLNGKSGPPGYQGAGAPSTVPPGEAPAPGAATAGAGSGRRGCLILLLVLPLASAVSYWIPRRGGEVQQSSGEMHEASAPARAPAPKPDLVPAAPPPPALSWDGSYTLGVTALPSRWAEDTLWRKLDGEEGERFRIPRNGLLTVVEAQLWTRSDLGAIVASVYRRDGENSTLLASSRVPARRIPRYGDEKYNYEVTPFTRFRFHPPLPLRGGDVIDVMFGPTAESAVAGIMMKDEYPGGVIAFYNGRPGIPEPVDWDFVMRITIRKDDGSATATASRPAAGDTAGPVTIGARGTVSLDGILMRDLGSGGEGQRFQIRRAGRLTGVEAAIWAESGRGEIVATVYRREGMKSRQERRIAMAAGEFPPYGGISSLNRLTLFRIEPPIPVDANETIDVIFRAEGTGAVSGILMTDAYPDTELVFYNKRPGLPEPVNWDFIARATVEQ